MARPRREHGDLGTAEATHRFERLGGGARFVLPRRSGRAKRLVGIGCLVPFGLIFAAVPLASVVGIVFGAGAPVIMQIVFVVTAVPFVISGVTVMLSGLGLSWGYGMVEVSRGDVRRVERIGPFRWTWRRPVVDLTRVVVSPAIETAEQPGDATSSMFAALRAEFSGKKDMFVAMGYPRATLVALGHALSEYCAEAAGATMISGSSLAPVEVVGFEEAEEVELQAAPRPPQTDIAITQRPGGLTINVPPAGVWRGSKGLFGFALFWCAFMVVFTIFTVVIPIASNGAAAIPFVVFCVAFWAIGIGVLAGALNMGRRRVIIDVVGDVLLLTRRSLFGLKQREWDPGGVREVRVGRSGMEVNDEPILELQIVSTGGERMGLLSQRSDDELRWLAHVLGAALAAPPTSALGDIVEPS